MEVQSHDMRIAIVERAVWFGRTLRLAVLPARMLVEDDRGGGRHIPYQIGRQPLFDP
mgnify:CR=1 FL=1